MSMILNRYGYQFQSLKTRSNVVGIEVSDHKNIIRVYLNIIGRLRTLSSILNYRVLQHICTYNLASSWLVRTLIGDTMNRHGYKLNNLEG